MKELTIEEKAKRYDDAIEKARRYYDEYKTRDNILYVEDMEDMFPELKESEDEKIKKEIIDYISKATGCKRWINWLEKQGENNMGISEATKQKLDDNLNKALEKETPESWNEFLEEQGEHKPADEVEPKFKVGDWTLSRLDGKTRQILGVHYDKYNNYYAIEDNEYDIKEYDRLHYHWTIENAKDGDVLSFNAGHGNDCIELIKSITGKKIEFWFCLTNGNSYEVFDGITPYTNLASRKDATPATKEQRDLLFAKMKEAGYEWDAEKKELKKIEDEPDVCEGCNNAKGCVACVDGSEWAHIEEKSFWSEEDERMFKSALWHIKNSCGNGGKNSGEFEVYNWFKSLKERVQPQFTWKPSDEQIMALRWVLNNVPYNKYKEEISGLLDQIKDL